MVKGLMLLMIVGAKEEMNVLILYGNTSDQLMETDGNSWKLMEFHGISWNLMKSWGIFGLSDSAWSSSSGMLESSRRMYWKSVEMSA